MNLPLRLLLPIALTALLASPAQAAEVWLGLSASAVKLMAPDANGVLPSPNVNLSSTWAVSPRMAFRTTVGAEYLLAPTLRVDATALSRTQPFYYGGGIGTGLFAAEYVYVSPLLLANVHGVVGKDFGNWQVEGQARLGLASSVGVNFSYLLGR